MTMQTDAWSAVMFFEPRKAARQKIAVIDHRPEFSAQTAPHPDGQVGTGSFAGSRRSYRADGLGEWFSALATCGSRHRSERGGPPLSGFRSRILVDCCRVGYHELKGPAYGEGIERDPEPCQRSSSRSGRTVGCVGIARVARNHRQSGEWPDGSFRRPKRTPASSI